MKEPGKYHSFCKVEYFIGKKDMYNLHGCVINSTFLAVLIKMFREWSNFSLDCNVLCFLVHFLACQRGLKLNWKWITFSYESENVLLDLYSNKWVLMLHISISNGTCNVSIFFNHSAINWLNHSLNSGFIWSSVSVARFSFWNFKG